LRVHSVIDFLYLQEGRKRSSANAYLGLIASDRAAHSMVATKLPCEIAIQGRICVVKENMLGPLQRLLGGWRTKTSQQSQRPSREAQAYHSHDQVSTKEPRV
jgi:hypothetical protein